MQEINTVKRLLDGMAMTHHVLYIVYVAIAHQVCRCVQEINTVKRLLDGVKRQPVDSPVLPAHAGQAFWAVQLKIRLTMAWDALQRVSHMLPPVTDGTTYAAVDTSMQLALAALEAYVTQTHAVWSASIQPNVGRDLDCRLLMSDKAVGGLLTCNFNKTVLEMFQEVRVLRFPALPVLDRAVLCSALCTGVALDVLDSIAGQHSSDIE